MSMFVSIASAIRQQELDNDLSRAAVYADVPVVAGAGARTKVARGLRRAAELQLAWASRLDGHTRLTSRPAVAGC